MRFIFVGIIPAEKSFEGMIMSLRKRRRESVSRNAVLGPERSEGGVGLAL